MNPALPSPPPDFLGAFRLQEELGAGAMGIVYRAEAMEDVHGLAKGTAVAVKVLHPRLLGTGENLERFRREGEIGRRVVHPNVVRTFAADVHQEGGRPIPFLVMELVEGQTLHALAAELESVPEALCRHVGLEVARGLDAIHRLGILHRDLKPENVVITPDQAVKIMDLGVARWADEALRLSRTGAFVGTALYAAPEQFSSGRTPPDARVDLFALGVMLHEMVTGIHPFDAPDFAGVLKRVLHDDPPRAGTLRPQVSPFLEEAIRHLLHKDRNRRPASAAAVVDILDQGEEGVWWSSRAGILPDGTRTAVRRVRIPRETPVFGRERELAVLREAFEEAVRGHGRPLLIEGETGVGKTRLVDELVERLRGAGSDPHFLFGSHPPGQAGALSGALTTAFREHFGEGDLDAAIAACLPGQPGLASGFASWLDGRSTVSAGAALQRDGLLAAMTGILQTLSRERPVVLLADDLHFATDVGRSLFLSLATAIADLPVLLVGTARRNIDDGFRAELTRIPGSRRMDLKRLDDAAVERLVRGVLGDEGLSAELTGEVRRRSDGNPFFAFELVRDLKTRGVLVEGPAGLRLTSVPAGQAPVPATLRDLVGARLAGLDTETRELLSAAACAGYEFDPLLLAEALGMGRLPLLKSLARLERDHRIVRAAGRRFVFDHHLFEEVLQEELPPLLREEYHGSLADALAARLEREAAPDDRDTVAVCRHYLRAGRAAEAVRSLPPALAALDRLYLDETALELAEGALALPGLIAGAERVEILLRKAEREDRLGRREAQGATLAEARRLASSLEDPRIDARVHSRLGGHLLLTGRLEEAREVLERALATAKDAGEENEEAVVCKNLGVVYRNLGRVEDARRVLERNLEISRRTGNAVGEAAALGSLGVLHHHTGDRAAAREAHTAALAICRSTGDRRRGALAEVNLGNLEFEEGRFDAARSSYESALSTARTIGDRRLETMALGNVGMVAESEGRYGEALDAQSLLLARARAMGQRIMVEYALGDRGSLQARLGDLPGARATLGELHELGRSSGSRNALARALHEMGLVHRMEGDAVGATERFEEELALRREGGDRRNEARALRALGESLVEEGRIADGRARLEEALAAARSLELPDEAVLAAVRLAALPGGDVEAALAEYRAREPQVRGERRMEALHLLWGLTGDDTHLAGAQRLLEQLVAGAPPENRASMIAAVPLHRAIDGASRRGDPALDDTVTAT